MSGVAGGTNVSVVPFAVVQAACDYAGVKVGVLPEADLDYE